MRIGPGGTTPEQRSLPAEVQQQILETGASALEGLIEPQHRIEAVSRVLTALNPTISIEQTEITSMQHVGPIPSPDTVASYDQILPGSADRLFKMAEKDQDAFIRSNARKAWLDFSFKTSCVVLGVCGLCVVLYGAVYLAERGHEWVAGTAITALGASAVIAIVNARMSRPGNSASE